MGHLVVNLTGAFALGAVGVLLKETTIRATHLRHFLAIGFLGSFTNVSALAMEGVRLIESHRPGLAAGYWVATLALAQLAVVSGMCLSRSRIQ